MTVIKRIALLFSLVVFSAQLSAHLHWFRFAKEWTMAFGGVYGTGLGLLSSWSNFEKMKKKLDSDGNNSLYWDDNGDLNKMVFAKDAGLLLGRTLLTFGLGYLTCRQTAKAWSGK